MSDFLQPSPDKKPLPAEKKEKVIRTEKSEKFILPRRVKIEKEAEKK